MNPVKVQLIVFLGNVAESFCPVCRSSLEEIWDKSLCQLCMEKVMIQGSGDVLQGLLSSVASLSATVNELKGTEQKSKPSAPPSASCNAFMR